MRRARGVAALGLVALVALVPASAEETKPPGTISFVGENWIATANGTFHRWHVTRVAIDRSAPERGEVEVEIDVASLDTGIERRDAHLRSADFFEVDRFPKAFVRVHHARPDGRGERGPRFEALFDVRIRDVEKTLTGHFEVLSETPPRVAGALTLDRMDFGIGEPRSSWNPLSIRQEIPITFEAVLPSGP